MRARKGEDSLDAFGYDFPMICIRRHLLCSLVPLALASALACAQGSSGTSYEDCLLMRLASASDQTPVGAIREDCRLLHPDESLTPLNAGSTGAISLRDSIEEQTRNQPFLLTSHRPNYMLPVAFTNETNDAPYQAVNLDEGGLNNTEFQFQLSLKFPLKDNFIIQDSRLWMGYTIRAFWQAYNADVSRPFRETNHEPEFIWSIPSSIEPFGIRNVGNDLILNHQSNGQQGTLSRSWNRLMLASRWEKGNLGLVLKPWVRIPERYGPDRGQDDNPDIEDYLGNFEFLATYRVANQGLSVLLRNNLQSENRGAVELSYSRPISERVDLNIRYFNGYGESLVDYNQNTQRLGLGIQITDWY